MKVWQDDLHTALDQERFLWRSVWDFVWVLSSRSSLECALTLSPQTCSCFSPCQSAFLSQELPTNLCSPRYYNGAIILAIFVRGSSFRVQEGSLTPSLAGWSLHRVPHHRRPFSLPNLAERKLIP